MAFKEYVTFCAPRQHPIDKTTATSFFTFFQQHTLFCSDLFYFKFYCSVHQLNSFTTPNHNYLLFGSGSVFVLTKVLQILSHTLQPSSNIMRGVEHTIPVSHRLLLLINHRIVVHTHCFVSVVHSIRAVLRMRRWNSCVGHGKRMVW